MDNFEELGFRYLNNGCMRDVIGSEDFDVANKCLLNVVDALFANSQEDAVASIVMSGKIRIKPLDLTMELVPRTTWGTEVGGTLRQAMSKKVWHDLREAEKAKCGNKCSICHSVKYEIEGRKPNLILHEVWDYNTSKVLQVDEPTNTTYCEKTLIDLKVICPICNGIKHFGRIYSEYKHTVIPIETILEVIDQFLIVNYESGIKRTIVNTVYFTGSGRAKMWMLFFNHLNYTLEVWRKNSQYEWIPNFGKYSYLVKNTIEAEKLR